MATKLKFLVAKFKVLVALATISVAILSPVFIMLHQHLSQATKFYNCDAIGVVEHTEPNSTIQACYQNCMFFHGHFFSGRCGVYVVTCTCNMWDLWWRGQH